MKEMTQYNYIRFLYFYQKISKRGIVSELGIHRNTVNKSLADQEQKYRLSTDKSHPINGNYKKRINIMIKENNEVSKELKLKKLRIYELLCKEGYSETYSFFIY